MKQRRRKPQIRTKGKLYPLEDSPFYKLKSKKRLALILGSTPQELKSLMGDQHYRCFVQKKNGKERDIEEPLPKLRKVHCRIASLLCRIEVFDGLHSGRKGRSNISNALAHLGDNRNAITCDITKFYPTTRRTHIFDFFYNTMECSPDVADLLSKLVSYEEHIPTGSQISMPLAYFSNKRMFDEIEAAASSTQSVLTIFVDDLTISGPNLQKSFIKELERIVEKHGHKINRSKTRFYSSSDIKLITGAAIDGNSIFPRNKHLKALQDDLSEWFETPTKKAKPISRILGRMTFIGSIDPRYKDKARSFRSRIKKLKSQ